MANPARLAVGTMIASDTFGAVIGSDRIGRGGREDLNPFQPRQKRIRHRTPARKSQCLRHRLGVGRIVEPANVSGRQVKTIDQKLSP